MTTVEERRSRIVLSTVPSDSHTWNLVVLQLVLEEQGYDVVNLGPCVPDELLVARTAEVRPDAVVISTLNGHGVVEGERCVRALRADPASADVPVVIGGKLGIRGGSDEHELQKLLDAGFTAVFEDTSPPEALPRFLGELSDGRRAGSTP